MSSCQSNQTSSSNGGICCTEEGSVDNAEAFSSEINEILFEVDYMTGMAPYTGNGLDGKPVWNLFINNVSALFNDTNTITAPIATSDMEEVSAGNTNYTSTEILALAEQHRNQPLKNESILSIYILFLDGYFEEDDSANQNILGVSIGSTGVIAIFKPAITDNTFPSDFVRSFTEQSVLIHEAGHAIGLVNNGITPQSAHHDEEHGAHCTNDDCIMYWTHEGAKELIDFIVFKNPSSETILFGQECLNDSWAQLP